MSIGLFITSILIVFAGISVMSIVGEYSDHSNHISMQRNTLYVIVPTIILAIATFILSCCVSSYRELMYRIKYDNVIVVDYRSDHIPAIIEKSIANGYEIIEIKDYIAPTRVPYTLTYLVKSNANINDKYEQLINERK